jgi:hypothetical protein
MLNASRAVQLTKSVAIRFPLYFWLILKHFVSNLESPTIAGVAFAVPWIAPFASGKVSCQYFARPSETVQVG